YTTWNGHSHISISNGPLALWRCSEKMLQETHSLALERGTFTHFHVSESSHEVQLSLEEYNLRPVEWLEQIGVLDQSTQLVHAVWLESHEITQIARSGAVVIHCPVSNAVLGSGIAPVARMAESGIPIFLGTDGPASNDTQDTWETLKAAVSLARITNLDPTILPPSQALSMALAGKILHEGSDADLILVDISHSRVWPVLDPTSALVLGTHGSDVDTVICGGRLLMQNKKILIFDEEALLAECEEAVHILRKKAGIA
ncbi:MAG: amidohydrolase family protein, partial [Anaerolineales bacterium]|nr:amidohydrolase family protein [Anaerolineales bacterium]